jgi:hypothetical protein
MAAGPYHRLGSRVHTLRDGLSPELTAFGIVESSGDRSAERFQRSGEPAVIPIATNIRDAAEILAAAVVSIAVALEQARQPCDL